MGVATPGTARCGVIRFVDFYVSAADWTDLVHTKPRDDAVGVIFVLARKAPEEKKKKTWLLKISPLHVLAVKIICCFHYYYQL